jgi:hypothetical protein
MYGKLREFLNPDREEGVFALPPCCHQLRQELGVLPLQYDSEGRMFLPPKDHSTADPHQGPSLRQLLAGRSPDRADSLVLAVWALSRPRRRIPFVTGPAAYVPDPNEPEFLSNEQLQKFPEPLRGIVEMYQDPKYRIDGDDWDDGWATFGRQPRPW